MNDPVVGRRHLPQAHVFRLPAWLGGLDLLRHTRLSRLTFTFRCDFPELAVGDDWDWEWTDWPRLDEASQGADTPGPGCGDAHSKCALRCDILSMWAAAGKGRHGSTQRTALVDYVDVADVDTDTDLV